MINFKKFFNNKYSKVGVGELVGSMVLSFICNAMSFQETTAFEVALIVFCGLAVLIYVFLPISKAQFNPFVTLTLWGFHIVDWIEVSISIVAQYVGGFIGIFLLNITFTDEFVVIATREVTNKQALSDMYGQIALIIDILLTIEYKGSLPLTVGAVVACGICVLPGGMIVNPMLAVMRVFVNSPNGFDGISLMKYIGFEAVGTLVGFLMSKFVLIPLLSQEENDHPKDPFLEP